MAAITGPGNGVVVPTPAVGPMRYGLFAAATGPLGLPAHGSISGLTYEQQHLGAGFLWPPAQATPPAQAKTFLPPDPFIFGVPFTVGATYQVGAIGHDEKTMRERAIVRLNDNAQQLVETAFWGGRTVAPLLTDVLNASQGAAPVDVTPTPGTAVNLTYGVALLEQAVANYGYRAVLHAIPEVAPYAAQRWLAIADGRPGAANTKYLSPMGNVWSFGRGYSGNKPVGNTAPPAPAGGGDFDAYLVATGPVTLWADPEIRVNPPYRTMDRSGNQVLVLAEQSWAAAIDAVAFYVLVEVKGT